MQVMKPMASTAHRWRLGLEDSLIAMDPDSKRLLRYDFPDANIASKAAQRASLEAQLWGERDAVSLRTDLTDCNIAVCSLEVLVAFSDNFDYQARDPHTELSGLPYACVAADRALR